MASHPSIANMHTCILQWRHIPGEPSIRLSWHNFFPIGKGWCPNQNTYNSKGTAIRCAYSVCNVCGLKTSYKMHSYRRATQALDYGPKNLYVHIQSERICLDHHLRVPPAERAYQHFIAWVISPAYIAVSTLSQSSDAERWADIKKILCLRVTNTVYPFRTIRAESLQEFSWKFIECPG